VGMLVLIWSSLALLLIWSNYIQNPFAPRSTRTSSQAFFLGIQQGKIKKYVGVLSIAIVPKKLHGTTSHTDIVPTVSRNWKNVQWTRKRACMSQCMFCW
jgi:hypothetical protein